MGTSFPTIDQLVDQDHERIGCLTLLPVVGVHIALQRGGHVRMPHQLPHGLEVAVGIVVQGGGVEPPEGVGGEAYPDAPPETRHGVGDLVQVDAVEGPVPAPALKQVVIGPLALLVLGCAVHLDGLEDTRRDPQVGHHSVDPVSLSMDGQDVVADVPVPDVRHLGTPEPHVRPEAEDDLLVLVRGGESELELRLVDEQAVVAFAVVQEVGLLHYVHSGVVLHEPGQVPEVRPLDTLLHGELPPEEDDVLHLQETDVRGKSVEAEEVEALAYVVPVCGQGVVLPAVVPEMVEPLVDLSHGDVHVLVHVCVVAVHGFESDRGIRKVTMRRVRL